MQQASEKSCDPDNGGFRGGREFENEHYVSPRNPPYDYKGSGDKLRSTRARLNL